MKIKMLNTVSSQYGVFKKGNTYDVEEKVFKDFVKAGHAEDAEPKEPVKAKAKRKPKTERATK